jgi:hypothetical protein
MKNSRTSHQFLVDQPRPSWAKGLISLLSKPREHTRITLVFAILALLAGPLPALADDSTAGKRVVAIGDIRGDFGRLTTLLRVSGLSDTRNQWVGGNSLLVLTGDFMDGKPQVLKVMDLLMDLEKEARKAGGRVITLLGNHEVMNIVGDHRYTTEEIYAGFADKKSVKRRANVYQKYLERRRQQAENRELPAPEETPELAAEWMKAHPLGYVEYRKAMAPKEKYGRWLRKLPAVVKIDNTIFLHGGIHPDLSELELREMNESIKVEVENVDFLRTSLVGEKWIEESCSFQEMKAVAKERLEFLTGEAAWEGEGGPVPGVKEVLKKMDFERKKQADKDLLKWFLDRRGWLSFHSDGPLWFRGFARWTEAEGIPQAIELLRRYGASHFVAGHTTAPGGDILKRFGRRVFLIDTVRPSALQIQGSQFTAIYPEGKEILAE